MKEYFSTLFSYDLWANKLILGTLIQNEIKREKTTYWMSHIINAQTIWIDRILIGKTHTPVHAIYSLQDCTSKLLQENTRYQAYISSAVKDTFQQAISYENSKGIAFSSKVVDILAHVINHSTHHRAQIVTKLREVGVVPPATDYIFFSRS
ncbi:MAG: DinB family protein [Bacteroidota bacterium]